MLSQLVDVKVSSPVVVRVVQESVENLTSALPAAVTVSVTFAEGCWVSLMS